MKVWLKASIVGVTLLALTGCGNSSNTRTPPSSTPSPTVSASPASLVCDSSQLEIGLGVESAGMGARGVEGMTFKNISTATCTLEGYPIIQMTDVSGKSIPTYVSHGNTFSAPKTVVKLVTIAPGGVGKFDLLYEAQTGYGTAICPTSTSVDFTPPGSTAPLVLKWKIQPYGGATIQTLRCGELKVSPLY